MKHQDSAHHPRTPEPTAGRLASRADREALVAEARLQLLGVRQQDGHFVFELEADTTIPSEYILLRHFLGEIDPKRERQIGVYLRGLQSADGSWPLFYDGDGNISATVKAYWALKLIGDDPAEDHMIRARDWILSRGGAAAANVFTRIAMALHGQVPWRAVPVMPVEMMLLPRWFPFHISKVAYWSRTVVVPLLVLYALKARGANPTGRDIRELFVVPPEDHRPYNVNPTGRMVGDAFLLVDKVLRFCEPLFPAPLRRLSIDRAMRFVTERLNGENGLGGIYPAMANTVMAMRALGYPDDHPDYRTAYDAIENLLIERSDDELYIQPCMSPVWDTGMAAHALMDAGDPSDPYVQTALDWLKDRQILDVAGDWSLRRPDVRPGGWAFQYTNDHYPDADDTAVVIAALHRQGDPKYQQAIDRGAEWLVGVQGRSGGWGAFEADNEHYYLNSIPFADHGALLDPPTADVTARCVGALAQVDRARYADSIDRGVAFLKANQEPDGSWYGRWGANYIYGTWSTLCALNAAGEDMSQDYIQRAVAWLKDRQRADGGWGEGLETYWTEARAFCKESTPSQTAWAVLGLMAAGEVECDAVARGIAYLENHPRTGPRWDEKYWTGTGFPRVFYLKYHGYAAFFPLLAVARYEKLMKSNDRTVGALAI